MGPERSDAADDGQERQRMAPHNVVDILEIYHARQLRSQLLLQLRRLHSDTQQIPFAELAHKKKAVQYYEAMLLTVVELLQQMGETDCRP